MLDVFLGRSDWVKTSVFEALFGLQLF
jgi:hypothetical protein